MRKKAKELLKEVQHWECSCCKKQLTSIDEESIGEDDEFIFDESVDVEHHFDISRSNKCLEVDTYGELVETYTNEKMSRVICETCFTLILNESETLGALFFSKEQNCFIY